MNQEVILTFAEGDPLTFQKYENVITATSSEEEGEMIIRNVAEILDYDADACRAAIDEAAAQLPAS